jgi:hypothetical protein
MPGQGDCSDYSNGQEWSQTRQPLEDKEFMDKLSAAPLLPCPRPAARRRFFFPAPFTCLKTRKIA